MTGERTAGIGAPQLAPEVETRETEVVHLLRSARRQSAANPDEAARAVGKVLAHAVAIEIGENGGELLDDLVAVEHAGGIGEQRVGLDVGGEQATVAVDDVGARIVSAHGLADG